MAYGLQLYNSSGALVFDSTTALGGCIIDMQTVAASTTATFTYPSMAGRTVTVQPVAYKWTADAKPAAPDYGATVDTALGYPRVTIASRTQLRTFLIIAT